MGIDDAIPNELRNVAAIQQPMVTGQVGEFTVNVPTPEGQVLSLPARSTVGYRKDGQSFLQVEVNVDGEWVPTDVPGEVMAQQQAQEAMNIFANSNLHTNIIQAGDPKGYGDSYGRQNAISNFILNE